MIFTKWKSRLELAWTKDLEAELNQTFKDEIIITISL